MKRHREWQTDKPPHDVVVEVRDGRKVRRMRAIWGDRDKGRLPHWESEDDGAMWSPDAFTEWRPL